MALSPVVSGSALAEDKVVGPEQLPEWPRANGVHGSWLQIDKDGARNVFATAGFIVINVDALQLEFRLPVIGSVRLDSMFVRDDLPELRKQKVFGNAL